MIKLKKQIKTPEFPPKKMMKFSNKVLEQRRLALQTYLQVSTQRFQRVFTGKPFHKGIYKFYI